MESLACGCPTLSWGVGLLLPHVPLACCPLLVPPRLQMDEELRREREREREREADREREKEREREQREKEREKELEREREKERERELERQREQRAREKELLAAKALEPTFLPVAELHGLRGHTAEERPKPSEQLTPTRAGTGGDGCHPGAGENGKRGAVAPSVDTGH